MRNIKNLTTVFLLLIVSTTKAQTIGDGIKQIKYEQYQKAGTTLRPMLKTGVNFTQATYALGNLYLAQEMNDSAKFFFHKAKESFNVDCWAMICEAKALMLDGKLADARVLFDKAIALNKGKNVQVLLEVADANIHMQTKDLVYANALLTKVASIDPKNVKRTILLGDYYLENNDAGKALEQYEIALEADKTNPEPAFKIGDIRYHNYDAPRAIESFNQAIKIDPSYGPAIRELAEVYGITKQYAKAVEQYKTYLSYAGNNPTQQRKYGLFLFQTKSYQQSLNVLEEYRKTDNTNNTVLRIMAYDYYELNDSAKAISTLDEYFSKQPKEKTIGMDYAYYGKSLLKMKKDSLGFVYLWKGLKKDSSNEDMYKTLIDAYSGAKRYGDISTVYAYKKQMLNEKFTISDEYLMGYYNYYGKKYALADSSFRLVMLNKPTYFDAIYMRAITNSALDPKMELDSAKNFHTMFVEKVALDSMKYKDKLINSYNYLGSFYFNRGSDKAKSKGYYQKILYLDPENKKAKEAMKLFVIK